MATATNGILLPTNREMYTMTPRQLSIALEFSIKHRFPMLITGAPGIGKTDLVLDAVTAAKAKLVMMHPVTYDPTDVKGMPYAQNGEAFFVPFNELKQLINAKTLTICFIDDMGQAEPAVQKALMQLLHGGSAGRMLNGHRIPDCVVFIGATNRKQDGAGVAGMLEPVKSRFATIVELVVKADDWVEWAIEKGGMPIELISFIRFRPHLLDNFKPSKEIVNFACPRTVASLGKIFNAGIPKGIEFQMIMGAVGEAFAMEFTAFLKIWRNLPDIDAILKTGKGTVPQEVSVCYALSSVMAERMTTVNIANAISYLNLLQPEIAFATIKDAITRKKELVKTKAFTDFSVVHGNALFN